MLRIDTDTDSHAYGQTGKKEFNIENVKVSNQAWDTNLISASDVSTGTVSPARLPTRLHPTAIRRAQLGSCRCRCILNSPSPFSLGSRPAQPTCQAPRSHSPCLRAQPVLETTWSPFNDSVVASGGDDGKICVRKVEPSQFDNWGTTHWEPQDFDPVQRIDASPCKVGQVLLHPTASHVLASASSDHIVKLWDTINDTFAIFSNFGDKVNILAPGQEILSANNQSNITIAMLSGTSMAM